MKPPNSVLWKKLVDSRAVTSANPPAVDTLVVRHAFDNPDGICLDHSNYTLPYNFTFTDHGNTNLALYEAILPGLNLEIEISSDYYGTPNARHVLYTLNDTFSTRIQRLCIVRPDVTLGIDNDTTYRKDRERFREFFRAWSGLRALCLVHPRRGVLRAHRVIHDNDSNSEDSNGRRIGDKEVLLPSLRKFEVEVHSHREPEYWWEELGLMLQSRAFAGHPLKRFVLRGYKCRKEENRGSWNHGDQLVWDLQRTRSVPFEVQETEMCIDERTPCLKHPA